MMQPSFSLNFLSGAFDPRITFSRALNTATRVNGSGYIESVAADTPRFDYDPSSLACLGLLIEQANTNLVTSSEKADLRFGSAFAATNLNFSANAGLAPDNQQTADLCIPTTTNATHGIRLAGLNTGQTLSVFAYNPSAVNYSVSLLSGGVDTVFDINAGTVVSGVGQIKAYKNGFYRLSIIGTSNSSAYIFIRKDGVTSYAGDGTTGVYLWGCQINDGVLSSYVPTNGGTATRNADVATITGANFSNFWQASKGGVLVRARPGTVSGVRPWLQFDDGTANEIIALRGNATNPELYIVDGGTPQAQIDVGTIAANTNYSLTGWWANNDCKARLDSGAVVTDTSATIPTVTQARLGSDGTNYLNGHLASISYYDSFSEQIYTRRKNKAVFNLM